jgi:ribosomal protein L11 methyltransferase
VSLTELELEAASDQAEAVEQRLFDLGAASVEFGDAGDEPLFEPPPGAHPLWRAVRVKAIFTDSLRAEIAAAALAQDQLSARLTTVADQDWVRAGLAGLTRIHSGGDLWIVPSWEPLPEVERGVFVHLDPGLAFGTGSHPTTAMCLAALAEAPPLGQCVLDYGCGSGILAIAALKLGATCALGVDIDPQALQATRSNAERNGIGADTLETTSTGVEPPAGGLRPDSCQHPCRAPGGTRTDPGDSARGPGHVCCSRGCWIGRPTKSWQPIGMISTSASGRSGMAGSCSKGGGADDPRTRKRRPQPAAASA